MKAARYTATGPAGAVIRVGEIPPPVREAGEALIRLHVSGVNPSDVKARGGARGGASAMPYPMVIPHSDGAGVVEAVGPGVAAATVGQRVWVWNAQWRRAFGTAAKYVTLPAAQMAPLPDVVSYDVGASLGIPAVTTCHRALGGGPVEGKTVLVSGGAGTVGRLAVQFARLGGAQVIATARGADGMERARAAGADAALDCSDVDLAARLDVPGHAGFTLDECAAAHEAVEAGARMGAVVVQIR